MEKFQQKLNQAGLTGNEAKVYLELLKKGELSANQLAKSLGLDRTLSYTILNHLIEKGLVNYIIKDNKKFFNAENPENLINPLKEKEIIIKDLIQELNKIQIIKEAPYEIKIYEGKEGLRTFLKQMIKYKEIASFGATGKIYEYFYEIPALVKEIEKKGFTARFITSPKFKEHEMTKIRGVQIKYLNIKSHATTSIFGDYISIHILTQKPLIILVKNKEIAESYKNHFEILWKSAKP